jgi:cytochrome c oxidase subunit 1
MGAHHGPAKGLTRWLFTTNHKDIGTMYLWFSFAMFLLGGSFAMIIRAELFQPGLQIVQPEFFNQMTTMHGLVMVFGAIMPAFVGLANWMIPLRARYGIATHEQLELLDSATNVFAVGVYSADGWRRS